MGYRLNHLNEPVVIAVSKPLLTEFGIHHRLESCAVEYRIHHFSKICKIVWSVKYGHFREPKQHAALRRLWDLFSSVQLQQLFLHPLFAKNPQQHFSQWGFYRCRGEPSPFIHRIRGDGLSCRRGRRRESAGDARGRNVHLVVRHWNFKRDWRLIFILDGLIFSREVKLT